MFIFALWWSHTPTYVDIPDMKLPEIGQMSTQNKDSEHTEREKI